MTASETYFNKFNTFFTKHLRWLLLTFAMHNIMKMWYCTLV